LNWSSVSTGGSIPALAAKVATTTIPIVFTSKSPAINRPRVEAFVRRYAEILPLDFAVTVDPGRYD
jgi:hypothetical protein